MQAGVAGAGVALGLVAFAAEFAPATAVGDEAECLTSLWTMSPGASWTSELAGARGAGRPVALSRQAGVGMR